MGSMSMKIKKKEYKLIKELGTGGNGKVVLALCRSDNRYYAAKVIPIINESKEMIQSLENEAEILLQ